jgi:ubiquinone/menaquinone biosynthesis C-methylase UbiE
VTDPRDYNTHISGVFTRASTTYDHIGPPFFSYFGKRLVEFGALPIGSKVLDIACGRGAVLFPASEAVSDSGEVIGIDISEGMIDQVQQEICRRQIKNTRVFVMDAEILEYPKARFDYVLCGLSLFIFPDLKGALAEFYRVLTPGGFIISSTFKKLISDELNQEWEELYGSYKDRIEDAPELKPSGLNTGRGIKRKMVEAGFINTEVTTRRKTFYYQDENEWWQTAWSHGYRAYLERIPSKYLPEFKKRALEIVRKKDTERGIPDRWDLLFTKAQKPVDQKAI